MTICDAVKEARGKPIEHRTEAGKIIVLPTNTGKRCLVRFHSGKQWYVRWNPTPKDLISKDWEVSK